MCPWTALVVKISTLTLPSKYVYWLRHSLQTNCISPFIPIQQIHQRATSKYIVDFGGYINSFCKLTYVCESWTFSKEARTKSIETWDLCFYIRMPKWVKVTDSFHNVGILSSNPNFYWSISIVWVISPYIMPPTFTFPGSFFQASILGWVVLGE